MDFLQIPLRHGKKGQGKRLTTARDSVPVWHVRAYEDGDIEAAAQLYEAVYGRPLHGDYYRWKLVETPWSLSAPNIWLADAGDRLAGHYAATPLRFKLENEILTIGHTGDAMTHPDFRRQGIFTTVASTAHEAWTAAGVPFMVGVPNERWLSRRGPLGYREQFKLAWFWRPLRPGRLLARRFGLPGQLQWLAALAGRFLLAVSNFKLRVAGDTRVTTVSRPGPLFDTLWQRLQAHYPALYVRDRAWLVYRYVDIPRHGYRIFLAWRAESPAGYIVYRLTTVGQQRTGWIADLFTAPHDRATQAALLRMALDDMIAAGADTARMLLSPEAPLAHMVRRAGFWRARGEFDASLVALNGPLPDLSTAESWFTMAGDYDIV